jgi:hypothetical protein
VSIGRCGAEMMMMMMWGGDDDDDDVGWRRARGGHWHHVRNVAPRTVDRYCFHSQLPNAHVSYNDVVAGDRQQHCFRCVARGGRRITAIGKIRLPIAW